MDDRSKKIKEELLKGKSFRKITKKYKIGTSQLANLRDDLRTELKEQGKDLESIVRTVRLAKELQKNKDKGRIDRKAFRDYARIENSIGEYDKELVKIFKTYKLPKFMYEKNKIRSTKAVGFAQLTDLHLNEIVELSINRFDFSIASQRLKKYVDKSKIYLLSHNVKNLLVGFTGDILNSDRRDDERLSQATNRAKATFLAVSLLRQLIVDFAKDFNVTVTGVVGNESRIPQDVGWTNSVATDNYDYTILNILEMFFENSNIKFISQGNAIEKVVKLAGQNALLIHGNQISKNKPEEEVQKIKGKYTAKNIIINFIAFGHYHSSIVGDTYTRGSSLVGANAYSNSSLEVESRASQPLHIFYNNGNRDSIKIDLQNIEKGYKGYNINVELAKYNARSASEIEKKIIVSEI